MRLLYYGLIWHIFIEQENKPPKDLLTHLAEVISKSRGRWWHDQILHCFRGVLICIYYIQLTAMFGCEKYLCVAEWQCGSQSFPAVCEVSGGAGSFDRGKPIDWDPQDVFVRGRGGGGGRRYVDLPLFVCGKHA